MPATEGQREVFTSDALEIGIIFCGGTLHQLVVGQPLGQLPQEAGVPPRMTLNMVLAK